MSSLSATMQIFAAKSSSSPKRIMTLEKGALKSMSVVGMRRLGGWTDVKGMTWPWKIGRDSFSPGVNWTVSDSGCESSRVVGKSVSGKPIPLIRAIESGYMTGTRLGFDRIVSKPALIVGRESGGDICLKKVSYCSHPVVTGTEFPRVVLAVEKLIPLFPKGPPNSSI